MVERTKEDRISDALVAAVEKIVGAVAAGAGTAAQAAQATSGAGAGTGGTTSQSGQSTQGAAGEIRVKDDVSASEIIESVNLHVVKDLGEKNKANAQFYNAMQSSNAKLYDVTASALSLAVLGASHHNTLQMQMASDHRDQNHDRQINVNETDAYATILAERIAARLSK